MQTKSRDDTGSRYGKYVDLIEICKFSDCTRFIPVYTGNIDTEILKILIQTVYPCVYREHVDNTVLIENIFGLSLCIQGTLNRQSK